MDKKKIVEQLTPVVEKISKMVEASTIVSIKSGNFSEVLIFNKNSSTLKTQRVVGKKLPLNSTSNGKLILAHSPENEQNDLIETIDFSKKLKKTIIEKDKLQAEAFIIKKQGFSLEDEEFEEGVRCLSVPFFDKNGNYIAGVGVIENTTIFTPDLVPDIYGILKSEVSLI